MDHAKKPNKIREIVRLQQILKKWRKLANSSSSSSLSKPSAGGKSIQFLKRTISFSDRSSYTPVNSEAAGNFTCSTTTTAVPKGYLAVCVGEEQKRFVIPTEYLGRHAFHVLLREAEEEFGFEQTGVLRIPCEVSVFETVLKMVQLEKRDHRQALSLHEYFSNNNNNSSCGLIDKDVVDVLGYCSSSESPLHGFSHHSDSPMCR